MHHKYNKTDSNKPWYEKWYYIISIIASIFAILGVSVFGISNYVKKDSQVYEENNTANPVYEQDDIKSASEDGGALVNEDEANTSDTDESEIPSTLFLPKEYTENTTPEKIIEDNKDFILQKKEEYMESGNALCVNNYVQFLICEEAAKIKCVNDKNVTDYSIIEGIRVPNAIIMLLDYETDNIICELTTNNYGYAEYHPLSLEQIIYCAIIAPDYNLIVSAPIVFNKKVESDYVSLTLLKEHDKFTPYFQIAINNLYYAAISNKEIRINYILKENRISAPFYYSYNTDEKGYITSENDDYIFIELNTRYQINVYLDNDGEYKTIDGSITNTNLFTVQFDYDTIEE